MEFSSFSSCRKALANFSWLWALRHPHFEVMVQFTQAHYELWPRWISTEEKEHGQHLLQENVALGMYDPTQAQKCNLLFFRTGDGNATGGMLTAYVLLAALPRVRVLT